MPKKKSNEGGNNRKRIRKEKTNNSIQWKFISNTPTNYSLGMVNDGRKTKGLFENKP